MRPIDADKLKQDINMMCDGFDGIKMLVDEAPTIEAVSPKVLEQYKWERDVAIKQLEELGIGFGEKKPDIQVVKHGQWEYDPNTQDWGIGGFRCSVCDAVNLNLGSSDIIPVRMFVGSKYCPHCGAKMDVEEET